MFEEKIFISPTKKKLSLNKRWAIKETSIWKYGAIPEKDLKEKQLQKPINEINILGLTNDREKKMKLKNIKYSKSW
jgi:hypothetical protein